MRNKDILQVYQNLLSQRRGPFMREGQVLTDKDSSIVADVYIQWLCLATDLGYLNPEIHKTQLGRISYDLLNHDVMEVMSSASELYSLIQIKSNTRFKAVCAKISTHLYPLIKDSVKRMFAGSIDEGRKLLQLFAFPTRLTLLDIDLSTQCLADYLAVEDEVLTEYKGMNSVIRSLNSIVKYWFRNWKEEDIIFRHGNGAVAFCEKSVLSKYQNLGTDDNISTTFPQYHAMPINGITTSVDYVSQTTFVPKSYKTFRTISMESPTLMYLQQGILRAWDLMVERTPYLKDRIGTHEQDRNKLLAKEGSLYRNWATIDLSSASDLVPYNLVKEIFKGTPVLRYLEATRSNRTLLPGPKGRELIDGELITIKKFAPMGSAVNFPVETMLFASICELVTRRGDAVGIDGASAFRGRFSVYGDDIIVPTELVSQVIDLLTCFGFKVNTSKSFANEDCWYRESCGGEYINGFDVTPFRISRKYRAFFYNDDVQIVGLIESANRCFTYGFDLLRTFYIDKLTSQYGPKKKYARFIPIFSNGGLLSFHDTNWHTRTKWSRSLSLPLIRGTIFRKEESLSSVDDDRYRYRYYWDLKALEKPLRPVVNNLSDVQSRAFFIKVPHFRGYDLLKIPYYRSDFDGTGINTNLVDKVKYRKTTGYFPLREIEHSLENILNSFGLNSRH